jgi:predicted membrane protein (TIGR00267 family)
LFTVYLRYMKSVVLRSLREIVFGLEDSLVSTLGTVTGIALATSNQEFVVLSGVILVAVEAASMSAGSFLSEESAQDAQRAAGEKVSKTTETSPRLAAGMMALFYVLGGAIPLLPYVLLSMKYATPVSIILTVMVLFCVGAWSGKIGKRSPWRAGAQMVLISFMAALVGWLAGRLMQ